MNWYKQIVSDWIDPDLGYYREYNPEAYFSQENMIKHFQTKGIDNIPELFTTPQNKKALEYALQYMSTNESYYENSPSGAYDNKPNDGIITKERLARISHDMGLITNSVLTYLHQRTQTSGGKGLKSAKRLMIGIEASMQNALTTLQKIVLYGEDELQNGDDIETDEGKFKSRILGGQYSSNVFKSLGLDGISSTVDWTRLVNSKVMAESIRNTEENTGEQLWRDNSQDKSYADVQSFLNINDPKFKYLLSNMAENFDAEAIAAFIATLNLVTRATFNGDIDILERRHHNNMLPNYNHLRDQMGMERVEPTRKMKTKLDRPKLK